MFIKELRLIQNDKFALLLIFILPTMIMATMYIATNPSPITVIPETGKSPDAWRIGVVDQDPTNTFPSQDLSENFTWYMTNSMDLIVTIFEDEVDALDALYFDRVSAYIVIPYGFEGNITGDIPAFIDVHISSTDLTAQMEIAGTVSEVVAEFRTDHGWSQREISTQRFAEFQPPGGGGFEATFGVFMIVFAVFIAVAATAAQAIVGDVPLNRMLLTPATKMEAVIAKVCAYFVVGMLQTQFLLILWQLLFNIDAWGAYHILNFVLALMSFSGASLGVLISTVVTTRLQANQSFLFLLFGSVIVGTGFIDVGLVDDYFPLNLGRVMMTDTAFKGVDILEFADSIYVIVVMSLIFMFIAWLIFARKKTLA